MLLLARKLLKQYFLVLKLRWSLRKFHGFHQDLINCHKWPRIFSVCPNHNLVLFLFMIYHKNATYINQQITIHNTPIFMCILVSSIFCTKYFNDIISSVIIILLLFLSFHIKSHKYKLVLMACVLHILWWYKIWKMSISQYIRRTGCQPNNRCRLTVTPRIPHVEHELLTHLQNSR